MKNPVILEKELKRKLFDTLKDAYFEVLRINDEEVIFYKNLKITCKKYGREKDIFHVKDTSSQDYAEISNIHVLNLIVKELENAN